MGDIAIIGAGLCGITAATVLKECGLNPCLFEQGNLAGGRLGMTPEVAFDLGAQYFTARNPRFIDAVSQWTEAGIVATWQVNPWQLTPEGELPTADVTARYVGIPDMNAISRYLASGLNIQTHTRITGCHYRAPHWWLDDASGRHHGPFQGVLVTVPAPQAQPLLRDSPRLLMASRKVTMEPCWALGLAFAEELASPLEAAFVTDPIVQWLAKDSSKPGRSQRPQQWVIHATSQWSQQQMEAPQEEVQAQLEAAFFRLLNIAPQVPMAASLKRWRYARGHQDTTLLFDEPLHLGCGGDWSHGARIEGAWLAGQELAKRMCQALQSHR